MSLFTTPSSESATGIASPVVYSVHIHDTSPAGHWLVVDMIRSSGARFDTTRNEWTIALPPEVEPLFAPGRLGEALLRGAISLETVTEPTGPREARSRRPVTGRAHRSNFRHRARIGSA